MAQAIFSEEISPHEEVHQLKIKAFHQVESQFQSESKYFA